jgi:hypothetical protein
MKARLLATMAAALASMESPQYRASRTGNINTPGNFRKCPKGAQEFTFGYIEREEFKCYARTEEMAYKKYKNFLNKR